MTGSSGRDSYHHGNLRNALLDAADGELVHGTSRLSLRDLARRCGVSQTAPYRHFPTKHDLLVALAIRAFENFADCLRAAVGDTDDPWQRLQLLGMAYVDYAREHPARLRLMFGQDAIDGGSEPTLQQASQAAFQILRDAVRTAIGDCTAEVEQAATYGAWGLVHGLASVLTDTPAVAALPTQQRARIVAGALAFYVNGLRLAEPGSRGTIFDNDDQTTTLEDRHADD